MNYEDVMRRCIELAQNAEGHVSPNPMVGCVVFDKDGNEISDGYHERYGEFHAERNALLKLTNDEARGGTLFVNLEPCSHYGKTPPCVDLIIERGIEKVVIGMRDVNPKVDGVKKLKDAGIEVVDGVLEEECKKLNEVFIKNMKEHKTFIAIKTAATLDGKIATNNGCSKWITSAKAREEVKFIRNRYDAIMTSSSTVIADNPSMVHKCNIILDRELKTVKDYKIYNNKRVIVFYDKTLDAPQFCAEFIKTPVVDGKLDMEFIFNKLYELGIMSVLIEAGGRLNGSALKYTDKIYHFIAPKILGDNKGRSCFDFRVADDINISDKFIIDSVENFEPDVLLTYYPIKKSL